MLKPIKRSDFIKPVSREHHHGLLAAWKIREGIRLNIDLDRIKKYTDFFWQHHLKTHFEFEETYMFPILGDKNELVEKALQDHLLIKNLFNAQTANKEDFETLDKTLVDHIRFEERIMFKEIEAAASDSELEKIENEHIKIGDEVWEDQFWLVKK